ncbi:clarin-3-like [Lutzomyia longipalpis]|uniref:clarin-3-like n=1 Tax=Lutzomyia longipalpis TaxID=7200 RepID=UPI00248384CD|nr:clarin-3-like [Lutzomyia longipalpis]
MMTKTRWIFLFATFVISCGSLIMLIVATTTTQWVNGRAVSTSGGGSTTTASLDAHYGLFGGSQDLHILNVISHYDLTMTCSFGDNICGLSCQRTPEARLDEITKILNGVTPSECPISSARSNNGGLLVDTRQQDVPSNEQFINAGLWLSSVVFLCITIFFALLCTVQSLTNILSNPIWSIFSVYGLYIWNGLAIAFAILTLILWGSLFATSIQYNIAVRHTLTVNSILKSEGLASLGFSYWILFGPILLHSINIGLLLWRKWLIEREPPPVAINVNRNDFTILLY